MYQTTAGTWASCGTVRATRSTSPRWGSNPRRGGRVHRRGAHARRRPVASSDRSEEVLHTAGIREHEEEVEARPGSLEIAPWIVFFQNVDAIVGPDEPIVYPEHLTEELDYELELAVVIAKAGKWFEPEEARVHRRLRDLQRHHGARHPAARDALGRLLVLQGDDTFCPLGPWIVTPDESVIRTT